LCATPPSKAKGKSKKEKVKKRKVEEGRENKWS
jgi:hypothetical protein